MAKVLIVDDPKYSGGRLHQLPACKIENLYNQEERGLWQLCASLRVFSAGSPDLSDCVVFLHVNNDEMKDDVDEGQPDYAAGIKLLPYAMRRLIKFGARVVVFSGGNPAADFSHFAPFLQNGGYVLGHHYALIPLGQIATTHPDLDSPIHQPRWRVDVLDNRGTTVVWVGVFAALGVLTQGALAVWRPEAVLGEEVRDVDHATQALKGLGFFEERRDQHAKERFSLERLVRRVERVGRGKAPTVVGTPADVQDLGWFWFDCCLEDVERLSLPVLVEMLPGAAGCPYLQTIWQVLRKESLGLHDGWSLDEAFTRLNLSYGQEGIVDLLEGLFCELECIGENSESTRKNKMAAFQTQRERINHNLLCNQFLNVLGTIDRAKPLELRSEQIVNVWNDRQSDRVDDVLHQSISGGLEAWTRKVLPAIRALCERAPARYGLVPTVSFEALRERLLSETGSAARISQFVAAFDEIGRTAGTWDARLQEFWAAADDLRDGLSSLSCGGEDDTDVDAYFAPLELDWDTVATR